MKENRDSAIPIDNLSTVSLETLSGHAVSRLGLASQYLKEVDCVQAAFEAGINYFFSYDLSSDRLSGELKPLLTTQRDAIFIATGSESRHPDTLQQYLDQVRRSLYVSERESLHTDVIDAFFAEYLSQEDNPHEVEAMLSQLQRWKAEGCIRYVGASTHNREIALQLIEQGGWDVLMLRYNMAHRKAEEEVLPAAQAAGLPVIAFTCTRWGSLLKRHPQWHEPAPTAADCYRYALHHPAVQVALTAPATYSQLQENLTALKAPSLAIAEIERWQTYGDSVYGSGQDAFETQWL
jgi:aryl-alcohol dehydrogenase-like predicted oxidoreductase